MTETVERALVSVDANNDPLVLATDSAGVAERVAASSRYVAGEYLLSGHQVTEPGFYLWTGWWQSHGRNQAGESHWSFAGSVVQVKSYAVLNSLIRMVPPTPGEVIPNG